MPLNVIVESGNSQAKVVLQMTPPLFGAKWKSPQISLIDSHVKSIFNIQCNNSIRSLKVGVLMKINWQGSRQLSKFSNTALFCEKNGFNVRVNERDLGDFHFAPKRGGVIWSTTFAWLLPDSTMTFKGRSDGLVVESDRKKISFCLNNGESILSILNTKLLYSKVFWYKLR